MPELPEVETIERSSRLVSKAGRSRASRYSIRASTRPVDLFEVVEELEGDRVTSVERRGKYLLLRLESGFALLVHLRMTGSFGFSPTSHERAVLELDDGSRLAYRDVRRFGTWLVLEAAELEPYLALKNGVEPLGSRFTARWLAAKLARRTSAAESRSPRSAGRRGPREHLRRRGALARPPDPLRPARITLRERDYAARAGDTHGAGTGIARQGSTLSTYAKPDGSSGSMQDEFKVYGRDGEPCRRCHATITKTRVGGRGTWYCPRCQPL